MVKRRIRYTVEIVGDLFLERGCELLSTEYKNSHTHLDYICSCGNVAKITMSNFNQGNLCKKCSSVRAAKALTKFTAEYVQDLIDSRGDTLLGSYTGYHDRLALMCGGCGRKRNTTFGAYKSFKNCHICGIKSVSGVNNPKFDKIPMEVRLAQRNYPAYREWVKNIYARDDYTCGRCGERGGRLNAHHLQGYASHLDLQIELSNGVTLCAECHSEFHSTYGISRFTKDDYYDFVADYIAKKGA